MTSPASGSKSRALRVPEQLELDGCPQPSAADLDAMADVAAARAVEYRDLADASLAVAVQHRVLADALRALEPDERACQTARTLAAHVWSGTAEDLALVARDLTG